MGGFKLTHYPNEENLDGVAQSVRAVNETRRETIARKARASGALVKNVFHRGEAL